MHTKYTSGALLIVVSLALAPPAAAQSSRTWQDHVAATAESQVRARLRALDALDRLDGLEALGALDTLDSLAALEGLKGLKGLRGLRTLDALGDVGQDKTGMARETERVTKTFRVGRTGSLDLQNVSGSITVRAGAGEDIVIEATKRARDRANLANVRIDMAERAGRVEVRTEYTARNARVSVDYAVTMPADATAALHSVSGDVTIAGIKGVLRVDTVSGNVHVEGPQQLQSIETVSGDVVVTGGGGGDVRAETVSGNLTLSGVTVRSFESTTVSGDVQLTDVTSGRTSMDSLSGDLTCSCPLAPNGRYVFKTHSGNVQLTVTSNTGFELNASTFSGDVRSDLPLTLGTPAPAPTPASRKGMPARRSFGHALKGTYGDGSALVTITTFSGDATVAKR
jgi:DUF4097 and DUF4098 domain-containing protein YvlB